MTVFLHAPNVHQGGGRTLLNELINADEPGLHCILDSRMQLPAGAKPLQVKRVEPSLFARFNAELWLKKNATHNDTVLCFGNLPPLFSNRGKVTVFLQNRYLFGPQSFAGFSRGARLRLLIERCWFRFRMQSQYRIIVQSETMRRELKQALGFDAQVLPFLPESIPVEIEGATSEGSLYSKPFDFIYVSSAEPHKNHAALLDAWVLLAGQGIRPSLALTVDQARAPAVAALIERSRKAHQLNIHNFGSLQHGQVHALYKNATALIFPSKLESFGLPLVEAQQYGLPILAPELDYVRDVVQPAQTFDAGSSTSIARAVMRHLHVSQPAVKVMNATAFLRKIKGE